MEIGAGSFVDPAPLRIKAVNSLLFACAPSPLRSGSSLTSLPAIPPRSSLFVF